MDQEQWTAAYSRYLSGYGFQPYELEQLAFNAWESWADEDPEEVASSDLAEMRSNAS